jgi:hypothetical protein
MVGGGGQGHIVLVLVLVLVLDWLGAMPRIGPMGLIGPICCRGDESSARSRDDHDRRDSLENGLARNPAVPI